jgi:hypothetical protein
MKVNPDYDFWAKDVKQDQINDDDIKPLKFAFVKLLISKPNPIPVLETVNGREVKNFKTFRKVIPLPLHTSETQDTMSTVSTVRSTHTFSFRPYRGSRVPDMESEAQVTIDEEGMNINTKHRKRRNVSDNSSMDPSSRSDEPMDADGEEDEFAFFAPKKTNGRPPPLPAASTSTSPAKSTRSATISKCRLRKF